MKDKQYYLLFGFLTKRTGQPWTDFELETIDKIRRLARKHQRLAEYDCNGEGYVGGKFYRTSNKDAFVDIERGITVFGAESDKVEARISALARKAGLTAKFQGDPRGATVRLFHGNTDVSEVLWI